MPAFVHERPGYWVYVKKYDNTFYQDSKPKRRVYVSENYEELGTQHYRHHLRLWVDGESKGKYVFESHHGYDRQVVKRKIIRNMILGTA